MCILSKTFPKHSGAVLLVLLQVLLAPKSFAGGFTLLEPGAASMGQSGANTVMNDGALGLFINPASLTLGGDNVEVGTALFFGKTTVDHVNAYGAFAGTANYNTLLLPPTSVSVSEDFGTSNLHVGFGIQVPNLYSLDFDQYTDRDNPPANRYVSTGLEGSVFGSVVLGASYDLTSNFTIGAGAWLHFGTVQTGMVINACDGVLCRDVEDSQYDIPLAGKLGPNFFPSGSIGMLYRNSGFKLGASFVGPVLFEGNAEVRVSFPDSVYFNEAFLRNKDGACKDVDDDAVAGDANHPCRKTQGKTSFALPWKIVVGVALNESDDKPRWGAEFAWVYEGWSSEKDISVEPQNVWVSNVAGSVDVEMGPIRIPRNMMDVMSFRLGGFVKPSQDLTVRAGGFYENGSLPATTLSVFSPDSDKVGYSLGLGVKLPKVFQIDLSGGVVHFIDRTVRNSVVPIQNPLRPEQPFQPAANGTYRTLLPFVSLGVRIPIDIIGTDHIKAESTAVSEEQTVSSTIGYER